MSGNFSLTSEFHSTFWGLTNIGEFLLTIFFSVKNGLVKMNFMILLKSLFLSVSVGLLLIKKSLIAFFIGVSFLLIAFLTLSKSFFRISFNRYVVEMSRFVIF